MKRKNVLILLLVFLLLLTPSCVLLVRALETSPFPERDKVREIEMRLDTSGGERADTSVPYLRYVDNRDVDLLYAIFSAAKRVPRSALPDKYASYRLTFRGERSDETLTLYFGASDYSLFILTSGKKLYRLSMPKATHRNTVLTPSAASFSLNGEELVKRYDYPETANGPKNVAEIALASWRIVTEFAFSGEGAEVVYKLYAADGSPLLETTDKNDVVGLSPDTVLMEVTTPLQNGISVTLHYYLKVQE